MNNLILDRSNYTSINGKRYGVGGYGCNYPTNDTVWNSGITLSLGSNIIITSGDFYQLLGGSIENSNVPLYKWLVAENAIIEIAYLLSSTVAVLTCATPYDGDFNFTAVDFFGQPTVQETLLIDSGSSYGYTPGVRIYTKNGVVAVALGGGVEVQAGSDPILVNFSIDFELYALNIKYE